MSHQDNEPLYMYQFYNDFYTRINNSKAFSQYCETVFGKDLSQDGFSDLNQLSKLIAITGISNSHKVLDLGCGNGQIAEYLSDITGADVIGIDYIASAIEQANKRISSKRSRLSFQQGIIHQLSFPASFFDTIISIDTIFFGKSLVSTINQLVRFLRPKGQLAIFYLEIIFDPQIDKIILKPDYTKVAIALQQCGLSYTCYDFTKAHYKHTILKNQVAKSMKRDFLNEGIENIWQRIIKESTDEKTTYDEFCQTCARYLYHIKV